MGAVGRFASEGSPARDPAVKLMGEQSRQEFGEPWTPFREAVRGKGCGLGPGVPPPPPPFALPPLFPPSPFSPSPPFLAPEKQFSVGGISDQPRGPAGPGPTVNQEGQESGSRAFPTAPQPAPQPPSAAQLPSSVPGLETPAAAPGPPRPSRPTPALVPLLSVSTPDIKADGWAERDISART